MTDFAVFILTHGRPDNVITLKTLRKCGYTGDVYFIIDNEDKTADKYYQNFGTQFVKMFNKKKYADECDECNNFDERRTITMARNACFDIAKEIGVTYFIELDDDYTQFKFRFENKLGYEASVKNIDLCFDSMLSYYKSIKCLSIAISQGGDHIGGFSFICSTERPFKFVGAMNEDVNTYTTLGSRGELFLTYTSLQLDQKQTQSQSGGITDMYLKYGTYCKSFTTVMNMPSSVKVSYQPQMGRLHHQISWNNTVPKIIRESYKK